MRVELRPRNFGWRACVRVGVFAPVDRQCPRSCRKGRCRAKPAAKVGPGLGQRNEHEVTLAEQLSFREQQVHGEMSELEQRMFRLSEALKKLEPENSSRLMLGLKYAREELILHQMKETQDALAKLSLKGAVEEQKQLMAKLERLQQLLLSTDLDFEMRLERLRQIRETLRKLDGVIKEESREEKHLEEGGRQGKGARRAGQAQGRARRTRQAADRARREERAAGQSKTRSTTTSVPRPIELERGTGRTRNEHARRWPTNCMDGAASKNLAQAGESMQVGRRRAGQAGPGRGPAAMEQALDSLKKELDEVAKKEAEAKAALSKENFAAMRKDQEGNRGATDEVTEMTRQLGNNGTAALAELMKASGSMGSAESAFGRVAGRRRATANKARRWLAQVCRRAAGRRGRTAGPSIAPRSQEARHRRPDRDARNADRRARNGPSPWARASRRARARRWRRSRCWPSARKRSRPRRKN